MIRVAVAGTSVFGLPSFKALHQADGIDIVGVISQSAKPVGRHATLTPSPVAEWAVSIGVPCLTPATWKDQVALETLRGWQPDVLLVAAYGLIVPATVLDIPTHGCVNIHASLLPAYRGASPITAAILNGDPTTGITFMQMDVGMDTGPILAQFPEPIQPTDITPTLSDRLAAVAAQQIVKIVQDFTSGALSPQPQPTGATLAKKIQRQDGQIDWTSSASLIERQLRAYSPWPGVWTTWQGRVMKILSGTFQAGTKEEPPGTIINWNGSWAVSCGDGVFIPTVVQLSGKTPQPAGRLPGSYPGLMGAQLGI